MLGFDLNQLFKHRFKDAWSNLKMSYLAEKRSAIGKIGTEVFPSLEYKIVFEDNFTKALDLNKWRYAHPWGDFHSSYLHQYYDNDGTLSYVTHEGLALELRKLPKSWKKSELPDWRQVNNLPDEFTIPVGVGLVTTRESWKYGWFEAWIKLPKGQSFWNAFWLSGIHTWPPEIDIFEAYSHVADEYGEKNWFGKVKKNRKIQPNLHYGKKETGTKQMYGAYDIPVFNATERFVQYACLWEHDRIEIYYDGYKVFQCTDPEVLKWFNVDNAHQYMILGHGLHESYTDNPKESAMLISKVKVWQKA